MPASLPHVPQQSESPRVLRGIAPPSRHCINLLLSLFCCMSAIRELLVRAAALAVAATTIAIRRRPYPRASSSLTTPSTGLPIAILPLLSLNFAFPSSSSHLIVRSSSSLARLLENVQKAREKRRGETRARAVSCGEVRHKLFFMKRQDRDLLRVIQRCHLKVS